MGLKLDVLIIGGGPAGVATALALRRYGHFKTGIVERSNYDQPRIGESLSPGARSLLEYLEVWPDFLQSDHLWAHGNSAAWGNAELFQRDFLLTPFGSGWHLDRRRFDADLASFAEKKEISVWRESKLEDIQPQAEGWHAVLDTPEKQIKLETRFVVDATGKSHALARRFGAKQKIFDRLVALVAMFAAPENADTYTLIETFELGWFYSVCLPSTEGNMWWVALMTDADLVRPHHLNQPETWWDCLQKTKHCKTRLQDICPERIQTVVAHSALLDSSRGKDWVAVGDASRSYDPLSSSGIVRALDSGIQAAIAIQNYLEGKANAFKGFDEYHHQSYAQYLDTWTRYYQMETRWPDSAFWRRRQTIITLDPLTRLISTRRPFPENAWPKDLEPLDPESLIRLCHSSCLATEVVASHPRRVEVGDTRIILGLQWLLQIGILSRISSTSA